MALFINGVGQDTFSMNGISIDNLYVDGVLVWQKETGETESTIQYKLIEDLVDGGLGTLKVFNSGVASPSYSGRLAYIGDGTSNAEDDFDPGDLYPKNGTIDLTMQPDGKGSTYIDTYLDIYEARLTQVAYDIVPGVSYKMYALHDRALGALDIYMGDSVNGYPDTPTYEITDYSPGTGTLRITSELPDVIPGPILSKAYISFSGVNTADYPTPNGEVVNSGGGSGTTNLISLVNSEGTNEGWTYQNSIVFPGSGSNAITTVSDHETNTGFHFDAMMDAMVTIDGSQAVLTVDPGTYTLTFTAGCTLTGDRRLGVTIDGSFQEMNIVDNYFNGITFEGIVTDGGNQITVDFSSPGSGNGYCSSMTVERTA